MIWIYLHHILPNLSLVGMIIFVTSILILSLACEQIMNSKRPHIFICILLLFALLGSCMEIFSPSRDSMKIITREKIRNGIKNGEYSQDLLDNFEDSLKKPLP